jgi:hydroxymethylpyrimidine pyrophosphatase-like HAD family hydrolase
MPAFQIPFDGIVLDFDGTVVDTLKRTDPVSQEIILEFERLLKDGIKLGIATGRGKSAYNILKEQVQPEFHKNIFVGLYNGTLINCLGDDLIVPTQRWNLKNILDHLITEAEIEPASVFSRNTQISVRSLSKIKKEALTKFLRMRLGVDAKYVKFCVSAHSLDILPHWASKIALVQELSTSTTMKFLCIGDQGQVGGNDEELLMRQPAICVGDKQPASNYCFWLGKNEKYRESSGTTKILKSIVKEKELFRLSMFDFGE